MTGAEVVVTQAGLVLPGADSVAALGAVLRGGRPEGRGPAGGARTSPLTGFDPRRYLDRRGLKDLSRLSQMACAAASPLARELEGLEGREVGVALGTAWGSLGSVLALEDEARRLGTRFINPLLFAESVANVPAGQISIIFGWSAFNLTICCGAASGLEAVRQASILLEEGRAGAAVAGGADELPLALLPWLEGDAAPGAGEDAAEGVRDGPGTPVHAEGACLLLLETARSARTRGARPIAFLESSGSTFTPAPRASGDGRAADRLEALLRGLLERAGRRPSQVDLVVSASGTGPGDAAEAEAIRRLFAGASAPRRLEPKRVLGEGWAASGPAAAVAALDALGEADGPVRRAAVIARCRRGHAAALLLARGGADAS